MYRQLTVLLGGCLLAMSGCGAQSMILGTEGSYLLTTADVLALRGEEIKLIARLQGGDLLTAQAGYVMRFHLDGKLFKAAQTDDEGVAQVTFTPAEQGDYRFAVDVSPAGLSSAPPGGQELLVACRLAAERIAVIDLDKTVVASGFHMVLIGDPTAMPRSAEILARLAKTHTIVYLTHRPDYFGPKSKAWLKEHDYPSGPVLLASVRGFLKGSGQYKSEMLAKMRKRFKKIKIGIGDKISDAAAYHRSGLKSFLIMQMPEGDDPAVFERQADALAELHEDVQVVTGWDQIDKVIFQAASFPRSAIEGELRRLAAAKKRQQVSP